MDISTDNYETNCNKNCPLKDKSNKSALCLCLKRHGKTHFLPHIDGDTLSEGTSSHPLMITHTIVNWRKLLQLNLKCRACTSLGADSAGRRNFKEQTWSNCQQIFKRVLLNAAMFGVLFGLQDTLWLTLNTRIWQIFNEHSSNARANLMLANTYLGGGDDRK